MYVCVCGAVTERHIRCAVRDGVVTFQQLRRELPVARCCGRCKPLAKAILADAVSNEFPAVPSHVVLPSPVAA